MPSEMRQGSADSGGLAVLHLSKDAPSRSRSYLPKGRLNKSQSVKGEKSTRKSNVSESLTKFLDDCGDEDLILSAAVSPRKQRTSLSRSDHMPRQSHEAVDSRAKRKGTKKDHFSKTLGHGSDHTPHKAKSTSSLRKHHDHDDHSGGSGNSDEESESDHESSERRSERRKHRHSSGSNRKPSSSHHKSSTSSRSSRSSRSRGSGLPRRSTSERGSLTAPRPLTRSSSVSERRKQPRRAQSGGLGGGGGRGLGTLDSQLSRLSNRRKSHDGDDDDNHSVSSAKSNFSAFSTMSTRSSAKSLGLDAGPLNAFLNADQRPGGGFSSGASVVSAPPDSQFYKERKSRQDAILNQAVKDRFNHDGRRDRQRRGSLTEGGDEEEELSSSFREMPDGEDDDQPRVKGKHKGALARLKKGLSKTGKVTKSTAKGTVNVVRDPKRAAKKVGGFAKDVGKETVKMVLDPTLAAKTAVNLGMDVTTGALNVTKGVTTGVAKGSLGLTKTVAKTGVNATSMVVGTALDGAGKVVTGATGLIFKQSGGDDDDDFADYHAKDLESRQKGRMSLLDRVGDVVDEEKDPDQESSRSLSKPRRNAPRGAVGLGVPQLLVDSSKKAGWEF